MRAADDFADIRRRLQERVTPAIEAPAEPTGEWVCPRCGARCAHSTERTWIRQCCKRSVDQ